MTSFQATYSKKGKKRNAERSVCGGGDRNERRKKMCFNFHCKGRGAQAPTPFTGCWQALDEVYKLSDLTFSAFSVSTKLFVEFTNVCIDLMNRIIRSVKKYTTTDFTHSRRQEKCRPPPHF